MMTEFEILGEIKNIETIATGRGVHIAIWNALMAKAVGGRGKEEQPCNLRTIQSAKPRYTGSKRLG